MGFFKKNKELIQEVHHDVQMAQDQVAQIRSNMAANGLDVDQAMAQFQAGMQSGAATDLLAMSQRAAKLMNTGVEMPAIVNTIVVGQQNMMTGNGAPVTLGVTVQPPMASPYQAAAQQVLSLEIVNQLHEGASITVKVAPDDPQALMFWGVTGAPAPAAPAPSPVGETDRVARLTKLQSLRESGAISDAEFEQQKARILSD